jgi:glycosyltransferase involved in cell wall biosynthesis
VLQTKIEIVTFTTLFPNASQPHHGIFVENRLQRLARTGAVAARVIAPVPLFPFTSPRFGHWSIFARVPKTESRQALDIVHPRFLSIPKIGMIISPALLFVGAVRAFRKMRRERDFDLIDAHYFYPDGVAAILLGGLFRKPVVITARGTDVNLIPQYKLPRMMIRAAARRASGIVAVSQALKDAIVALGIPERAVTVLRNGVDLEVFHPGDRDGYRRQLRLSGKVLLSVGHLIERKGHAFAIEALPRLQDCKLLIAGDGPERFTLERLANRLGVTDRVRFLGALPHDGLQRVYAAADALILASSREGWPNVLLESMACGTPVVATNVWGNPEVVAAPEAGRLMESRSAEGVADAVKALFSDLPDRGATRAFAEKFSWDATSMGQQKLFEDILTARAQNG